VQSHAILFAMRKTTRNLVAVSFACGLAIALLAAPGKNLAKQFLNVDGKQPPGYTHVVISAPGKMIFISGRGGAAHDGTLPPDFKTQAQNTFEDLKRCLALAGASFKDVVKINYYVTDLANTNELRAIRAGYLDMAHPPAATLVQAGLAGGALLEIEAVAMIPEK
jgi:enamine deaminase RidA (YjgF/YER057c/UK114 family)